MIQILLVALIGISCWLFVNLVKENCWKEKVLYYVERRNQTYQRGLSQYYEKTKTRQWKTKVNGFYRIGILLDRAGVKQNLFWNPVTFCFVSLLCFVLAYHVVLAIMKIVTLSLLISLPAVCLPYVILQTMAEQRDKKLEKIMLNFLLQLKNSTKLNNDIIYAFREVKTTEPLQGYIKTFLLELNSGMKFEKAVEHIKEKISFSSFRMVFTNMQYCYLHGGSFSELMDKNYRAIAALQKEKQVREQETMSERLVLGILMGLNLLVYMTYIKNNPENYQIMTKSVIGMAILYWNFISIWLLVVLMHRVKKLDY